MKRVSRVMSDEEIRNLKTIRQEVEQPAVSELLRNQGRFHIYYVMGVMHQMGNYTSIIYTKTFTKTFLSRYFVVGCVHTFVQQ